MEGLKGGGTQTLTLGNSFCEVGAVPRGRQESLRAVLTSAKPRVLCLRGPGAECLQMRLSPKIQTLWSLVTIAHKRRIPAQAGRERHRGMECFSEEFVLRAGRENRIPFSISFLNF